MSVLIKNSNDFVDIAIQRGLIYREKCSAVLFAQSNSEEKIEDFYKKLRENPNFNSTEMIIMINKLYDVLPFDIIEKWIRQVAADPDAALILCVFALRWKDQRKKIFFEEFVKTFADDPHYHLSQVMLNSGEIA